MAGPLNGIGIGQTQVPISNTFQSGQSNASQVRPERPQREPETNTVQAPGTPVSGTQNTETNTQNASGTNERALASGGRGSVVDITV